MGNAIYDYHMTAKLTLDKAGRVVIPKKLRDELNMSAGDSFELKSHKDQVVLKPIREQGRMYKKRGMWVFSIGRPMTAQEAMEADSTLDKIREERDRHNLGLE
jgi:AbrB family looped-hinge helix DNA binding protein